MTVHTGVRQWPGEGLTRVPYWIYSDQDLYAQEQERIFRGNTWNFLCLEAELPRPNTFRTSNLGDMPVVVTRDADGKLHAFGMRSKIAAPTAARCCACTSRASARSSPASITTGPTTLPAT